MQRLGTMVFSLILSFLAASALGIVIVLILRGDDSYVPVIFAVGAAALIALPLFAVASLFSDARRAIRLTSAGLIVLLGLLAFGIAAIELGAQGSLPAASRGIEMAGILFVSCAFAILLQGAVFRSDARRRRAISPPVRFGRGAAGRSTR